MTPDQLTALAARLRDHAAMHESVIPHDDEQRQWRDDLLDAAEYLRQCAEAEPVAWLHPANSSCVTTDPDGYERGIPLYTHLQPQQAGVPQTISARELAERVRRGEKWNLVSAVHTGVLDPIAKQAIEALAAIDNALGLPKDGCNSPQMTLAAIKRLKNRSAAPQPPSAQTDAVEALRELVALQDMKERLRDLHERGHSTDYEDYYRRKPLAWKRARAVLAAQGDDR